MEYGIVVNQLNLNPNVASEIKEPRKVGITRRVQGSINKRSNVEAYSKK